MSTKIPSANVRIKRAYEAPSPDDGERILIDRLWPRGVKKEALQLAGWDRDVSPSTELRHWFNHQHELWPEFRRRYATELARHPEHFEALRERARKGVVTLVYSARDETVNNAVAMREYLLSPDGLNVQ